MIPKTTTLLIFDGFGYRTEIEHNAIAAAHTPHYDKLLNTSPYTLLSASAGDVGLPNGQMGNSEVGHVNMGAGRVVYQDLTRIDRDIQQGTFAQNPTLTNALKSLTGTCHIIGLLSPGGVHSHEDQLFAMIKAAQAATPGPICVHPILDGRDTPPQSAKASLIALQNHTANHENTHIGTLIGRFYAMDRDQRWDRVEAAYQLLTGQASQYTAPDAIAGLKQAYARGETDEFVQATRLSSQPETTVRDEDTIIFMNFRADRARELTHAFVDEQFEHFARPTKIALNQFVTLTPYEAGLPVEVAYPKADLPNVLGDWLAQHGKTQLRVAETEKYAHVTFFFNGGLEAPFTGESRTLIPSPKVATYDLQPEMSADAVCDAVVNGIQDGQYDLIVCNFANADMVGHTGNEKATVAAIEALDRCLGRILEATQAQQGQLLLTADHGNAEQMYDPETQQPHTAHTTNPVPLIYYGSQNIKPLKKSGILSDIAPTILMLMGLDIPPEMTGTAQFTY